MRREMINVDTFEVTDSNSGFIMVATAEFDKLFWCDTACEIEDRFNAEIVTFIGDRHILMRKNVGKNNERI